MSSNSRILAIFARRDRPGSPKTGPEVQFRRKRRTGWNPALDIPEPGPSGSGPFPAAVRGLKATAQLGERETYANAAARLTGVLRSAGVTVFRDTF